MSKPFFFTIALRCPQCGVSGYYFDKPDIVCDFCVTDIKIKGELQKKRDFRK